jgi:hypothetical protein
MGTMTDPILVWRFDDAPEEFRALSTHGGDEDWIAVFPVGFEGEWVGWAEEGTSFGVCSVSEHLAPDGRVVLIGAHS